jgi:hypothetical protein
VGTISKLNPVDQMSEQWKHWKICNHMKSLLFYSGDTNDQMKPAEDWEENEKIIVGYKKSHCFQNIISELERYIPLDAFQLFYQCNPTNIDDDMMILVNTVATRLFFVMRNVITQQ